MEQNTFDFVVIGSGFGGAVSALRLVEKGYRVLILEKGKNFQDADFPKSNWDVRRYLWAPWLRCFGIQKLTFFKDVLVLSGVGVGGGSLVYANTLMRPPKEFFQATEWSHLGDWEKDLEPFYTVAEKYLGAVTNPVLTHVDQKVKETATALGYGNRFKPTRVAVYFGEPGKQVPDPYFGGEGPARTGCIHCGGCMVGCRHNAKNSLPKNYLYLAQKKGAQIQATSQVVGIYPLVPGSLTHGKAGPRYRLKVKNSTQPLASPKYIQCHNVVLAAGVLGTLQLLFKCRSQPDQLPRISQRLGRNVRTNSEVFTGSTTLSQLGWPWKRKQQPLPACEGIAISSIVHPDAHTSIEPVRYPKGSNFMRLLSSNLVEHPHGGIRSLLLLKSIVTKPILAFQLFWNNQWSENSIIFLVMQTLDNRIKIAPKKRWYLFGKKSLSSEVEPGSDKVPSEIPSANAFTRKYSELTQGVSQCAVSQATINIPTTAHVLGGCPIGKDDQTGVIDTHHRLIGYEGIYVCDGSAIPANLGVNPSLTIVAMTERAMSLIPPKENLVC